MSNINNNVIDGVIWVKSKNNNDTNKFNGIVVCPVVTKEK